MKRKFLLFIIAMLLCLSLAACGDGDKKNEDESNVKSEVTEKEEENAVLTKEKYDELRNTEWRDFTPEEMEEFLGVKYVVNEESTEDWGEGYLVVDFPGPDEESSLRVLFKADDTGKFTPSSLSANGQLSDN